MKVAFCLAILALAAPILADDDKVLVLDADNFDSTIAEHDLTLVEFYAPWCGHCKALAPEYSAAAEKLEGQNAGVLAKVDCTEHRSLCEKYEVRGFPTLKLFRNDGSSPQDFDQARKTDAIVKFMKKANAPAVTTLADASAVAGFAADESVKVVAFYGAADDDSAFVAVAKALRNEYSFGLTKDAAAASAEGVTTPAIKLYRDFDDGPVVYSGDVSSEEEISTFIKGESFPLVGEIGPENYAKYVERGLNFVWIFLDPASDDQATLLKTAIHPVAKEQKGKLSFVHLDGVKWAEHAKSFGLSGNTPGVVIEDREKSKNFVLPEDDSVTLDSFRAFVNAYVSGDLQPHVKSEPEPESNDGPVTVLVGTTFDQIVMDDSKDVLVEFYAPWCGHCKSLAPKYDELGAMFADNPNVVIAKVDATANDTPAKIQGFPTLIFYPAGDKSNPINYDKDRTAKAMADFIKEHGKAAAGGSDEASKDEL